MRASDLLSELKRTIDELSVLNDIGKTLTSSLDISNVMATIFQKVSELLRPRNWSVILSDEANHDLYFAHAVGVGSDKLLDVRLATDEGIAGWVFTHKTPLAVPDVEKDPRFNPRFDKLSGFRTRSILAAPLVIKEHCLGVVELVYSATDEPFHDRDLRTLMTVADFAAIALDNARNYTKVQELTVVDEHTSLFNARHLAATLKSEVARAMRFGHPVSLIFLDLDHFKQVNDTHGHQVGSATLREVGRMLVGKIRSVDVPTRYGGDEFVIVLPETGKDQALLMAERLRKEIAAHVFVADRGLAVRLTGSFGVACFPDDASEGETLLRQADQAMYRVKQALRDGVEGAHPATAPKATATR